VLFYAIDRKRVKMETNVKRKAGLSQAYFTKTFDLRKIQRKDDGDSPHPNWASAMVLGKASHFFDFFEVQHLP